jgi:hypothetical protein
LQWDALPCASNDEYVDAAKSAGPTTPLTQDAMADESESEGGDGASSDEDEDEDDEGEGDGDGEGGEAKAARGAKATNRYTRRWLDLPPLQVTLKP